MLSSCPADGQVRPVPPVQALRGALRPRCHVREPQLLGLLRELLRCDGCSGMCVILAGQSYLQRACS